MEFGLILTFLGSAVQGSTALQYRVESGARLARRGAKGHCHVLSLVWVPLKKPRATSIAAERLRPVLPRRSGLQPALGGLFL